MEKPHTKTEQKTATLLVLTAVAETIREVGEAPSGIVYAALMAQGLSFESYQQVLSILKGAKLIKETPAHLLRWIGPTLAATR